MPLHPFLVHFPLALVVAAWAFFTLGLLLPKTALGPKLLTAGRCCLVVAALSALPALVSGHWLEPEVSEQTPHLVPHIQTHEHAATFAAWMLFGLAAGQGLFLWLEVKHKGADWTLWLLLGLVTGLMLRVGYLGALLVHAPPA